MLENNWVEVALFELRASETIKDKNESNKVYYLLSLVSLPYSLHSRFSL